MKTLRFHAHGDPGDVLQLDDAPSPVPSEGQIRVKVHACGLNPADWALCRGLFASELPRGIGLCVSGTIDELGAGVTGVRPGEAVFGATDFSSHASAGASDYAILRYWAAVPEGLSLLDAATLPMAVETALRSIDILCVAAGQTLLVHGAGTMMGYAGVQMGLLRGARVIATAGQAFAAELSAMGAQVTPYGEGMAERVLAIAGRPPDVIFDAGPISDVLPELVRIAGGDAHRIVTISNHGPGADALGVRNSFGAMRWDAFAEYGQLAAQGRFRIPIGGSFALEDWREAMELSVSGRAHGKLMLLPG